ncbi:MAG: hypothetical protein EOO82_01155 [Oxalobacteraceae bacterium]|nr:MAG: hypothetical protein EOO82_01155 [Oxalobacteraceae bacterium]
MSMFERLGRILFSQPVRPPETNISSAGPNVVFDYDDERIPSSARDRIRTIQMRLAEIDVAVQRDAVQNSTLTDIQQMRDVHLPKLVASYVDIPAPHRSEIFRRTGKSASFILNESLDQMIIRVDGILKDLAEHDIDAFTDNIQFIGIRYQTERDPFQ